MAEKYTKPIPIRVTETQDALIRRRAAEWNMDVSALVRVCVGIALPQLEKVPFMRRLQMEDNTSFE